MGFLKVPKIISIEIPNCMLVISLVMSDGQYSPSELYFVIAEYLCNLFMLDFQI